MRRREFLFVSAAVLTRAALGTEVTSDLRLKRIRAYDLPTKRVKFVGKNARLDDHGDHSRDRIVIFEGSDGVQGIGCCHADQKTLSKLLTKTRESPQEILGSQTMPLWDLLAKRQ